jgi:hypothetical protein
VADRLQSRIVGEGLVAPDQLLAHPDNWRLHPVFQQDALRAVLEDIGWVQSVIVNQTTGHVVDGHLRVELALAHHEVKIPVQYVRISEEEERLLLATLDPMSALAGRHDDKIKMLLAQLGDDRPEELRLLLEYQLDTDAMRKQLLDQQQAAQPAAAVVEQAGDTTGRLVQLFYSPQQMAEFQALVTLKRNAGAATLEEAVLSALQDAANGATETATTE